MSICCPVTQTFAAGETVIVSLYSSSASLFIVVIHRGHLWFAVQLDSTVHELCNPGFCKMLQYCLLAQISHVFQISNDVTFAVHA